MEQRPKQTNSAPGGAAAYRPPSFQGDVLPQEEVELVEEPHPDPRVPLPLPASTTQHRGGALRLRVTPLRDLIPHGPALRWIRGGRTTPVSR
ncbi:hypothetical protein FQA47_011512 [Oryzias melastigma]|uniref:Uncharacterized protein n=1 Tax=Oryzias melastigma TaxID=30732 RepID=A0A834KWB8_ORYME|nr:hypothetical protein FQA47_011512 [Oryzias melastigma]